MSPEHAAGKRAEAEIIRVRLLERIRRHGPITFAGFVEVALYDPDGGFYSHPPIGRAGHFVTSPHVSPAFADLLAVQVADTWEALGGPDPFWLVEIGAGDGTLARRLLSAAAGEIRARVRYVAVERSAGARRALVDSGLRAVERMGEVGSGLAGIVIANEVLDNMPFHVMRERDGEMVEILVGATGEDLVEVEATPTPEALAALDRPLQPGEYRPVSPAWLDFVRELRVLVAAGHAVLIDYGFAGSEAGRPPRAYAGQRQLGDVLGDPGGRDLTVDVDFGAVAREAARCGFEVWGPVLQRDALRALGFHGWLDRLRRAQAAAEAGGETREALRLFSARSEATVLSDPAHLGGLGVLALGAGVRKPRIMT